MSFEARIQELGLTIPEPPKPAGHFVPAVQVGNLLFVSGQIPTVSGQILMKGKLGRNLLIEQGQEAARQALCNVLAAIRSHRGGQRLCGAHPLDSPGRTASPTGRTGLDVPF